MYIKKPDTDILVNHYIVIMALAYMIIVNKKKAVVYSKSVHRVLIALFVEYLLCFRLLCHDLRLQKLKNSSIAYWKNSSFCLMCSI